MQRNSTQTVFSAVWLQSKYFRLLASSLRLTVLAVFVAFVLMLDGNNFAIVLTLVALIVMAPVILGALRVEIIKNDGALRLQLRPLYFTRIPLERIKQISAHHETSDTKGFEDRDLGKPKRGV